MMQLRSSLRTESIEQKVNFEGLKHVDFSECHSNFSEIIESVESVEYLSEGKAPLLNVLSLEEKLAESGQRQICQDFRT